MKLLFQMSTSVKKNATKVPPSLKVGMHVLGSARNDGRVMRSATALQEAGFAVSIVDIEEKGNHPEVEEIHGIYVKHILMPSSFITTRFRKWALLKAGWILILGILKLLQTPSDIYHAHDANGLPASYIAALLRRKPLIFDAHELPLAEISIERSWLPAILARLLSHIVSYCKGVITVSLPIAQEISKRYHCSNVSLIRNIPSYRASKKSNRLREYLSISPNIRIALYQGYLDSNRGLANLIYAASFLEKDIIIVLMGNGIGATKSQIEALIESEGVADRVKIIPYAPYAELLDWTASADIGLIVYTPDYSLNVKMCLPNKLFEFIMAGLPVLASQLDAVVDIIKTYEVGQIVTSLAPADIGAAINTLVSDPIALARMHHNALEAAKGDLCWERESQHLIEFYNYILELKENGDKSEITSSPSAVRT